MAGTEGGAAGASGSLLPNQTLYVNNINDKIHKTTLRRCLYALFSQFGPVLDVVALKTPKMRGQAHIVFKSVPCASAALRGTQGFVFFGKPMRVSFAKGVSNVVLRDQTGRQKKRMRMAAEARQAAIEAAANDEEGVADASKGDQLPTSGDGGDAEAHNIIFVSNLPPESSVSMLEMLFSGYDGYKEVRPVPGRPDIAFVEFENELQAEKAKTELHGFKVSPTHQLAIAFANKGN